MKQLQIKYDGFNHIERIPIAVKHIDYLFHMASEVIEADRIHVFWIPGGTRIDDNEYLESLENAREKEIQKLSIYFELKRYVSFKKSLIH